MTGVPILTACMVLLVVLLGLFFRFSFVRAGRRAAAGVAAARRESRGGAFDGR